ncbi:hypothetical protein [Natrinema ejinorense]|uniref:Uncharacterized protein n=1 Tax=Natrinema ejinorense TaxID=373386 RepID=A0A2A5QUR4_9EURY|nr:hypothetical protein [Natrinema ejinorense]PCR90598.1 hypothetical protein CP557_08800 [Natrinema ejinorense]
MALERIVFGLRVVELLAGVFAAGSAGVGLYIGYQAFRGLQRHSDPSMWYLGVGLILLTTVTYTFTFLGSLLVHLRLMSLPQQDYFSTVAHVLQFAGLCCLAYAMHRRG